MQCCQRVCPKLQVLSVICSSVQAALVLWRTWGDLASSGSRTFLIILTGTTSAQMSWMPSSRLWSGLRYVCLDSLPSLSTHIPFCCKNVFLSRCVVSPRRALTPRRRCWKSSICGAKTPGQNCECYILRIPKTTLKKTSIFFSNAATSVTVL